MVQFEQDGTDYYDDYDTNFCKLCNCDQRGTIDEVCDASNGQCICKPGFGGQLCDQGKLNDYSVL